ncbi:MAG: citrate transporter [Lachnospiraceae bacterium]|nr:citrate transporter [Lachnospiraceae bacterium]
MEKIAGFIKKEAVLCIALLLALISTFVILPDREYVGYIDFRTLAILFSLMSVMAGLQKIGLFRRIAQGLLSRVKSCRSLVLIFILLCFFLSMLITNDVALITFVPFTFTVLEMVEEERRRKLILPLVAMETIAANLGSMLTPIGNPQNLYLYGKAGISIGSFVLLMLPYALVALILLAGWGLIQGGGGSQSLRLQSGQEQEGAKEPGMSPVPLIVYLALFVLCLLAVARALPWQAALALVLVTVLVMDRKVLVKVDYSLLLTFVGFFVFIGNMGRIPAFRDFLQEVVAGREVYVAIAASQIISNVPAALLLSGFTENYGQLIVGVNLGGLGTLIASMASLISYKHVAREESGRKGAYIGIFTLSNLCFLAVLVVFHAVMAWLR